MARKSRTFVVIGLGTFGGTLARDLQRFGNHVIGVDLDERHVAPYADDLGQALILDARDDAALRAAGIDAVDVGIVAIGTDIEASVLATINLKTIGVETIWAKATSKNHHRILSKLGVDRVVHPEREIGQHVAQVLNNPLVRDYVSLGNGQHVVNFRVPSSLQGKTLAGLSYERDHNLRCIGVLRGTDYVGHDGKSCELEEDDLLLLLGSRQDLRDFASLL
ncbi:TrkA family potassium uptake protein [Jannaschia sp. M317]|uniref:potassium channel family protein n=1 Tax=Jannaschia sp. M317 TaxID=2867011 RepID=UPI0021A895E6|nr:TrkA family potassium uptake protein [Jannaschia sp. M317]UWQ19102.1 TrkA family potassium uptake protein [Jannaschia sp. M317]